MKKTFLKTICVMLVAVLCVGNLNAQSMSRSHAKKASSELQQSFAPQPFSAKTPPAPELKRGLVLSEGFETGTKPDGWFFTKTGSGTEWQIFDALFVGDEQVAWPHSGNYFASNLWNGYGPRNAWMISTGFTLITGIEYTISFWMGLEGFEGEHDKFKVCLGNAQTVAAMESGNVIYNNPGTSTVPCWTKMEFTYTPTSTGVYYLGFHAYSDANKGDDINIDDIEISGIPGAPCPAIENLAAEVQGTDVKLTWTAAEGNPIGYTVYDGNTVLTTVTETEYLAKNLSGGERTLGVKALYDGCEPVIVTTEVNIKIGNPVKNLNGTCVDGTLNLTWNAPDAKNDRGFYWLTYSADGINPESGIGLTSGGDIMSAARFTPQDLASKGVESGHEITQMQIAILTEGGGVSNLKLKIWEGGSSVTNPGTLIVDQDVDIAVMNNAAWTTIDLESPIVINASKELRIGYSLSHTTATFPLLYDYGTHVSDKSDLLHSGGWTTLYDVLGNQGCDWNACIKAGISGEQNFPEVIRYDVYQNDVKIGEVAPPATSFTKTGLPEGESNYCVVAVYNNDAKSQKVYKSIICGSCLPPTNLVIEYNDNCSQAKLIWESPSTLPVTYDIYRDGVLIKANHNSAEYNDNSFNPSETHNWEVVLVCQGSDAVKISKTLERCTNSVKDIEQTSFTIVPNPAVNIITITAESAFNTLEIINFLGQTVLSQPNDSHTAEVDVSTFTNGVYFVRVISETGTSIQKFVKQ